MRAKGSLTIGRVRGIPVKLHFTFLIILPYVAWVISRTTPTLAALAGVNVESLAMPSLALGSVLALGLFFCVLIHEFAHVGVGTLGGAKFSGVTLMLVGGVSEMQDVPRRPINEAAMAVAGPVASAVLAGFAYVAYLLVPVPDLRFGLFYLAYVNLALAVFNLLPAFPMDGGRILRALLATFTTRVRATRVAAWVGQGMALLFLLGGALTLNWVLLLIGILVVAGARAELEMVRSGSQLEGLKVEDAMAGFAPTVDSMDGVSVVHERIQRELKNTYFVLERGDFVGAVTADAVRAAHSDGGGHRTMAELARRDVPNLSPERELLSAMRELRASRLPMLPVVRERALLGFISLGTIAAAVRNREARRDAAAVAAPGAVPMRASPDSDLPA